MDEQKTLPEQAQEHAKNYFRQGLNCSECVMQTYLDLHGSTFPKEIVCLATGFGGGMGHTKNTCGAITGAVMALSAVVGRADPMAKDSVAQRIQELNGIYDIVGEMVHEMEDKFGTLICSELSAPHGDFESKARKKSCMQMIGDCAEIAMRYIEKSENQK